MKATDMTAIVLLALSLDCAPQRDAPKDEPARVELRVGEAPASSTGQEESLVPENSAAEYWFFYSLGLLDDVEETEEEVTGRYQGRDGQLHFRIRKDALEDSWARTEGMVLAVERLIVTVERSRDPRQAAEMMERLTSLTGETFAKVTEWRAWFDENRDYLRWSAEKGVLVPEISAAEYWFYYSLGLLDDVEETEEAVTGRYQGRHGQPHFRIRKDALEDRWARTEGTVFAVERLIVTVEHSQVPEQAAKMIERLTSLTGETFANADEWKAWFDENTDYLLWSVEKGALLVDSEAKERGTPAREYRQGKGGRRKGP